MKSVNKKSKKKSKIKSKSKKQSSSKRRKNITDRCPECEVLIENCTCTWCEDCETPSWICTCYVRPRDISKQIPYPLRREIDLKRNPLTRRKKR